MKATDHPARYPLAVLTIVLCLAYITGSVHWARGHSVTLTWSLDSTYWPNLKGADPNLVPSVQELVAGDHYELETLLQDSRSWTRANLKFEYIDDPETDIRIVLYNQTDIKTACRWSKAAACASVRNERCTINLLYSVRLTKFGFSYGNQPVGVINHELGHCFGFKHSDSGLMKPEFDSGSLPDEFPTPDMIRRISRQFPAIQVIDSYR